MKKSRQRSYSMDEDNDDNDDNNDSDGGENNNYLSKQLKSERERNEILMAQYNLLQQQNQQFIAKHGAFIAETYSPKHRPLQPQSIQISIDGDDDDLFNPNMLVVTPPNAELPGMMARQSLIFQAAATEPVDQKQQSSPIDPRKSLTYKASESSPQLHSNNNNNNYALRLNIKASSIGNQTPSIKSTNSTASYTSNQSNNSQNHVNSGGASPLAFLSNKHSSIILGYSDSQFPFGGGDNNNDNDIKPTSPALSEPPPQIPQIAPNIGPQQDSMITNVANSPQMQIVSPPLGFTSPPLVPRLASDLDPALNGKIKGQITAFQGFAYGAKNGSKSRSGGVGGKPSSIGFRSRSHSVPDAMEYKSYDTVSTNQLSEGKECECVATCEAIKRVIQALKWYSDIGNNKELLLQKVRTQFGGNPYDNTLLRDYQHIINCHLERQFEINMGLEYALIKNELNKQIGICDVNKCLGFKRYITKKKDRDKKKKNIASPNNNTDTFLMDFMDLIHCFLVHLEELQ